MARVIAQAQGFSLPAPGSDQGLAHGPFDRNGHRHPRSLGRLGPHRGLFPLFQIVTQRLQLDLEPGQRPGSQFGRQFQAVQKLSGLRLVHQREQLADQVFEQVRALGFQHMPRTPAQGVTQTAIGQP